MSNYPSKYTVVYGELVNNGFTLFDDNFKSSLILSLINITLFESMFNAKYELLEIGQETPYLFKISCQNLIKYRQTYYNELLKPLATEKDFYHNFTQEITAHGAGTDNGTNKVAHSDTPQGRVSILNSEYYSDLSDGENSNASEEDTSTTITGAQGVTEWDAYVNYRNTYVNLIQSFVDEFRNMFMLIY